MPKVIAIDRSERHLRYVIAEIGTRSQLTLLRADTIKAEEDAEAIAQDLGQRLRAILAEQKATKARVLFGIGRGTLETVEFTVPAASEAELPSMVRNLAMRNLSSIGEETVLDFLTCPPRADGSRDVTAMTIRDDVQQELGRLTTAAGTEPSRILVRPYELKAFLADSELTSQVVLIVSGSPQFIDVLLVHPDGWQLARSIRLTAAASPSNAAGLVVNEIRRTLFSLPLDEFDATHIDRILLLASADELQPLATELGTALDAAVQRQSPFFGDRTKVKFAPSSESEFAPLVGMLINEANGSHPVDFLNPRRPPKPVNRRKMMLSAAAVVAALVLGAGYFVNAKLTEIDEQNRQLVARRNELKDLAKEVQPKLKLAKGLAAWESSRISWLDELRDLTLRMPSNGDMTVQRFSVSPSRGGDASITFSGEARAPEVVTRMEQNLRDSHHLPKTPGLRERPSEDKPVWTFQTTMIVKARSPEEYAGFESEADSSSQLAASRPAAPPPATDGDEVSR